MVARARLPVAGGHVQPRPLAACVASAGGGSGHRRPSLFDVRYNYWREQRVEAADPFGALFEVGIGQRASLRELERVSSQVGVSKPELLVELLLEQTLACASRGAMCGGCPRLGRRWSRERQCLRDGARGARLGWGC